MTETTKHIKQALDIVRVDREQLNSVCKDRLDFGFDSIYFRYAAIRDELAVYKFLYDKTSYDQEKTRANHDKMHFYRTLEQLLQAHDQEET